MNPRLQPIFAAFAFASAQGIAAAGPAELVPEPAAPPADPYQPKIRVSAGAVWRDLGGISLRSGSYSPAYRTPLTVAPSSRIPAPVGAADSPAGRVYDDGYVFLDGATDATGDTWFWGYAGNGQVQGDALVFTARGMAVDSSRQRSLGSLEESVGSDGFEAAPQIEFEALFPLPGDCCGGAVSLGPQLGFAFFQLDADQSGATFYELQSEERRQLSVRDAFSLQGIIPPLAPYSGSFAGPGPVIANRPSARATGERIVARERTEFYNRVQNEAEVDLYALSFGGAAEIEFGRAYLQLGGGLAVNVADWELANRETLYARRNGGPERAVKRWEHRDSGTDLLVGGYVQAAAGVQVTESLSLRGFARYDWSQELSASAGAAQFDADLGGFSAGAMLTWQIW